MNLQRFTDGGAGEPGSLGNPAGGPSSEPETKPAGEETPIIFKSQSELDSMIDKKLSKSLETAQKNWEKQTQSKLAEAEKKGKMTAEEQKEFELQQAREELELERLEIQKDKDESSTIKRLSADKLPDALSQVLTPLYGGDADLLNEVYSAVTTAYRESVKQGVKDSLAASAEIPSNLGGASSNETGSLGKRLAQQHQTPQTGSKFFRN